MKKRTTIAIAVILLLSLLTTSCSLLSGYNDYSSYTSAFKKTFDTDSMELGTTVKASLDGGTSMTSTGTFKLKGMKSSAPQFINVMTINGQTVTQFCDGQTVYTDDGTEGGKNKMSIGTSNDPQPQAQKQNAEFSYDSYISEFSSMIDAGKIKEMNTIEPIAEKYVDKITTKDVDGGKQYDVVLLPAIIDELKDKFLNEGSSNQNSPTVDFDTITYTAIVKDGYIAQITFNFNLGITAPGDTAAQKATVELTIKPVNPGTAVSFDLPSTDGF